MAVAITRHAALKSRITTPPHPDSTTTTTILEEAKLELAKQKQKAQVVFRHNSLSKIKCVRPGKPRGCGAGSSLSGGASKAHLKPLVATSAKVKVVTVKLPWNIAAIPARTDSGLKPGQKTAKSAPVKHREPKSSSSEGNLNKQVVRRTKSKAADANPAKRRSRSFDSLMEEVPSYGPPQCFQCKKDLSRASSRLSDTCSSISDVSSGVKDLEAEYDVNGNRLPSLEFGSVSPLPFDGGYLRAVPKRVVDAMSDSEFYRSRYESDSQLDTASDTEFYRCKARAKDKRHLYLDLPVSVLLKERRLGSPNNIKERKIQLKQDLDSLLDSMENVLKNPSQIEQGALGTTASGSQQFSPPEEFLPIFEEHI